MVMTRAQLDGSWFAPIAQERPASFALGFVSGFVDIAGYLALFGLFPANMTGNVLLAAVSLVRFGGDIALSRVVAVPLFMLGVLVGWLISTLAKRRGWPVGAALLTGETVALTLFLVVGVAYGAQVQSSQQFLILMVGFFALVAMGLQNVVSRELFTDLPGTTAMTTNLTLFVLEIIELIGIGSRLGSRTPAVSVQTRYARAVPVLGGFVIGAIVGAYGVNALGFWSITVPIVITGLLAVVVRATTKA